MHTKKTCQSIIQTTLALLIACYCLFMYESSNAQMLEVDRQLDRHDRKIKVSRSTGSRLDKVKSRQCLDCVLKSDKDRAMYLKRVVMAKPSNAYQSTVESIIFENQKFVNKCWKRAIDKGIEFFFTVSEEGKPSDFAWFPKKRAGICIHKHIAKLEFPKLEKPHHSWLVVTGMEY